MPRKKIRMTKDITLITNRTERMMSSTTIKKEQRRKKIRVKGRNEENLHRRRRYLDRQQRTKTISPHLLQTRWQTLWFAHLVTPRTRTFRRILLQNPSHKISTCSIFVPILPCTISAISHPIPTFLRSLHHPCSEVSLAPCRECRKENRVERTRARTSEACSTVSSFSEMASSPSCNTLCAYILLSFTLS